MGVTGCPCFIMPALFLRPLLTENGQKTQDEGASKFAGQTCLDRLKIWAPPHWQGGDVSWWPLRGWWPGRQKGWGMTKIRTSTLFTKHELQNPSHDYLRANIFLDVTKRSSLILQTLDPRRICEGKIRISVIMFVDVPGVFGVQDTVTPLHAELSCHARVPKPISHHPGA